MKTLTLIRHAKSAWKNSHLKDEDRPLKKIGIEKAYLMVKEYGKTCNKPDLIISSSAIRTIQTALIFSRELNYEVENIRFHPKLYLETAENIILYIKLLHDTYGDVILFGHNPSITNVANILTEKNISEIPTCGIFRIKLSITKWENLKQNCGKKELFI